MLEATFNSIPLYLSKWENITLQHIRNKGITLSGSETVLSEVCHGDCALQSWAVYMAEYTTTNSN